MKRVLLCTIMRDCLPTMGGWIDGILGLVRELRGQYEVEVSVYENDSADDTTAPNIEGLLGALRCGGTKCHFTSETLGTQRYGSVWNLDRLRNLANARQKCLDQVGDLSRFDKVAFIEPDVTYDPHWCAELILARHPHAAGIGEPDIYSGWSLRTLANPKESVFLYDTCATRASKDEVVWDINEWNGKWRGKSVVPTDLGGADGMCLHEVWSTFNCFCVYNAAYFAEGGKWGYVNHRLNTGQERVKDGDGRVGWLECDTAQMCEAFRARDYDKVFLNTNCLVRHS